LGKDAVGVRTDEPNRTDYENQNHCQYHSVFRDGLTFVGAQKLVKSPGFNSYDKLHEQGGQTSKAASKLRYDYLACRIK